VDQRSLPASVVDLYLKHVGRPAIIVGGGPSAPSQLASLPRPVVEQAVIVSANGHAPKLGLRPDYVFCKDHTHTETRESMEALLRPIGAPIVSRQYWADFRAPQWPIQGNSGQMALALGVLLGCAPVIGIGFDCYQNGTYFHNLDVQNVSAGRRPGYWASRFSRLALRLNPSHIRALDGPLTHAFKHYDPSETFVGTAIPPVLRIYADLRIHTVVAKREFGLRCDARATIPVGRVMALSAFELDYHLRVGDVAVVDNPYSAVIPYSP
jgi:hypothetical protein